MIFVLDFFFAGVRGEIEICASVFNSERLPYAIYERRGNVYQKVAKILIKIAI